MIKAIIFDCFGVLITDALEALVDDLRTQDSAKAEQIVSLVMAANRGQLDPKVARTAVAEQLGLSQEDFSQKIKTGEVKNQALLDYIKELRATYKIGLLSNIMSHGLQVRFSDEELATHFDAVVASGDTGFAKPEHQAYQYTADQLGVRADECIMIDDREDYCDGARSAGMQAIRYQALGQLKNQLAQVR